MRQNLRWNNLLNSFFHCPKKNRNKEVKKEPMEEIVAVKLVPEKKGVPSVTGTDADDDNHVLIYI